MDTERLRCIVSGLNRYELTELEQRFVQSVEQYFKREGKLTKQQEGLYREKTRWIRNAILSTKTNQNSLKPVV